jgi:Domain of unknown function (DUF3303)
LAAPVTGVGETQRRGILAGMLFMIIERFKNGDPRSVAERFRTKGRMLPDGVAYHASWIDPEGGRCFQLMESPNADLLRVWASHWDDLVDFEIVRVVTSEEFWKQGKH